MVHQQIVRLPESDVPNRRDCILIERLDADYATTRKPSEALKLKKRTLFIFFTLRRSIYINLGIVIILIKINEMTNP